MSAYYNEHDKFAAEWLRKLIAKNLIAPGEVDERDIQNVQPEELRGFTQCHFFAGIGVWSYALRAAGWPDDSPVWTGSCPCQGFSASGKRGGFSDQRHLWPAWFRLIAECRPNFRSLELDDSARHGLRETAVTEIRFKGGNMEVKDPTVTVSNEPFSTYDARAIWYGPHNCAVCGDLIVKMAFEQGGLELDAPQEPIYPNHRWTTHNHNPNPTKIQATVQSTAAPMAGTVNQPK